MNTLREKLQKRPNVLCGVHLFQVKAISLTPEIWSVENGLLTPTLKFKRPALKSHFKETFEDLYSTIPE